MGLGGHVVLINGTKYTWKKTYSHTYQMNSWKFPEKLDAGTVQVCYVEFNQQIFKEHTDDKGECFYQLEGTNFLFQILANARSIFEEDGFQISIKYENFSNLGSNTIVVKFDHNGYNPFSISGREGKFISTNSNASNWMSDNFDLLGNRLLNDLCLPGSHDSGKFKTKHFFPNPNFSANHFIPIFRYESNTFTDRICKCTKYTDSSC